MRRAWKLRAAVLVCGQLIAGSSSASSGAVVRAARAQPAEFLVFGVVIATDPAASLLTIREANLLGRLHIQTRSYHVKLRSSLADMHSGDRVTAVFSAKDGMLHRLTRVRPGKPGREGDR